METDPGSSCGIFVDASASFDPDSLAFSFRCACSLAGARKPEGRRFSPRARGQLRDQGSRQSRRATSCSRGFPEDLRPAADVRGAASGVTEGGFPLGHWASSQSDIPLLEMCPVDLPRNSEGHVQEGCPKCICIFTTRNRNDRGVAVTLTHAPVPTVRMPAHLPGASSLLVTRNVTPSQTGGRCALRARVAEPDSHAGRQLGAARCLQLV